MQNANRNVSDPFGSDRYFGFDVRKYRYAFVLYAINLLFPRTFAGDEFVLFIDVITRVFMPLFICYFIFIGNWSRIVLSVTSELYIFKRFIIYFGLSGSALGLVYKYYMGGLVHDYPVSYYFGSPESLILYSYGYISVFYLSLSAALVETIFFCFILYRCFRKWHEFVLIGPLVFCFFHLERTPSALFCIYIFQLACSIYYVKKFDLLSIIVGHFMFDFVVFSIYWVWFR